MPTYRGGCHCGRIRFEVDGVHRPRHQLQLLDLRQDRLPALGRRARARSAC